MQTKREFPKNNINRKVIYLIIWIVIFILMAAFIMSGENKDKTNENANIPVNNITYEDDDNFEIPSQVDDKDIFNIAKESLLKKQFSFTYTYDGPTGKVIYTGTNNNNIIELSREDINGIQKLYIENDILYKITLNEKVATNYEINHETYLDIDYVLENIDISTLTETEDYLSFNILNNQGKLYIIDNNISKIEIYKDIETYTLEFSNINI